MGGWLFRSRGLLVAAGDAEARQQEHLLCQGLGNLLPDGSRTGTNPTTQLALVSALRRIWRAASFEHEAAAFKLVASTCSRGVRRDWSSAISSRHYRQLGGHL